MKGKEEEVHKQEKGRKKRRYVNKSCLLIGFMVLTKKSMIFCVVTPYSSERARRFGGTYRFNLQGGKVSRERNQQNEGTK
jgi:hypothetical protein